MQRRKFLKYSSASAALIATSSWSTTTLAQPLLAEDDPIAIALGYKADANDVDTTKYPKRAGAEGQKQFCYNCKLYQPSTSDQGGCTAIPGKNVTAAGWCNAWIAK